MAKDNRKKKKSCVPLDGYQAEQARETYHCGNRKEGALRHGKEETDCGTQRCRNSFSERYVLADIPIGTVHGRH